MLWNGALFLTLDWCYFHAFTCSWTSGISGLWRRFLFCLLAGGGIHDGSKPLPDDRSESIWALSHFHLCRMQEEIQRGQQGLYRLCWQSTNTLTNSLYWCCDTLQEEIQFTDSILFDRMWPSRTTLWSKRCFTSSSWLWVRVCVCANIRYYSAQRLLKQIILCVFGRWAVCVRCWPGGTLWRG